MDGFLNLLKPPGMTSHDAVAWLRRLSGETVGHAGTLDRAAAGVLVLCVGRARRLTRWVAEGDKAYIGEVTLGISTDTLDAEGRLVGDGDASGVTAAQVRRALGRFVGEIEQRVPAYSAVHVNGVRLHRLARAGREAPRPVRRVRITSARLLDFVAGRRARARIAVECSKGTYMRSLAADLGAAVGCGAHLSFLVRTRAGGFELSDSATIEEAQQAAAAGRLAAMLRPLDEPLSGLPAVRLEERAARLAQHGNAVPAPPAARDAAGPVRLYGPQGGFIGLASVERGELRPRVVVG